jgi:hypothetical protein
VSDLDLLKEILQSKDVSRKKRFSRQKIQSVIIFQSEMISPFILVKKGPIKREFAVRKVHRREILHE